MQLIGFILAARSIVHPTEKKAAAEHGDREKERHGKDKEREKEAEKKEPEVGLFHEQHDERLLVQMKWRMLYFEDLHEYERVKNELRSRYHSNRAQQQSSQFDSLLSTFFGLPTPEEEKEEKERLKSGGESGRSAVVVAPFVLKDAKAFINIFTQRYLKVSIPQTRWSNFNSFFA